MKNHGFNLPLPKQTEPLDLQAIEDWMAKAEAGAGAIGREVLVFARIAQGLLSTGLTRNATALLIQDLLPKTRRGNPTITLATILRVLDGAASLAEHVQQAKGKR